MTPRNILLLIFLSLFLLGYAAYWAYQSQYLGPRKKLGGEIAKLSQEIETYKNNHAIMAQFWQQHQGFFYRSLPPIPNDAKQYSFWLLELLQYSGFEENNVTDVAPARIQVGANYRFNVRCTGTLSQLSHFLFEFYYAPFLHRIATLTLTPVDGNTEKMSFAIAVDALALRNNPYPATSQLPTGWIPRLASNDPAMYNVISERNFLQTAKGGIDRADYTFLTGILQFSDHTEVWFSVRTDDSRIEAKLGDTINAGSFTGKIVEIHDQDIVLNRNGTRWLLTTGESLNEAFALPPETE